VGKEKTEFLAKRVKRAAQTNSSRTQIPVQTHKPIGEGNQAGGREGGKKKKKTRRMAENKILWKAPPVDPVGGERRTLSRNGM